MTNNNSSGWMTASGPAQSSSPLAAAPAEAKVTVGRTGLTSMGGRDPVQDFSGSYTTAPTTDRSTGYEFKTKGHGPIPAGGPRGTDLVTVGGMDLEVQTAIQLGLIDDVLRPGYQPRPFSEPQGFTDQDLNDAPIRDEDAERFEVGDELSDADLFSQHIASSLSPQAMQMLEADIEDGELSDLTKNYFALEAGLDQGMLDDVHSSFVSKACNASGLTASELSHFYEIDRKGVTAAIMQMVRTGDTSGFAEMGEQADAASRIPLGRDEAAEVWRDAEFPQALIDAGLEPVFEGGAVSINIPGRGTVRWTDAVRQGLVQVSRS